MSLYRHCLTKGKYKEHLEGPRSGAHRVKMKRLRNGNVALDRQTHGKKDRRRVEYFLIRGGGRKGGDRRRVGEGSEDVENDKNEKIGAQPNDRPTERKIVAV